MWKDQIDKLLETRAQHAMGGGEKRIARQHESGRLTAKERIDLLLDPDSFTEIDSCMSAQPGASVGGASRSVPGDGVLTGFGLIEGRRVCVAAEDFTVVGGTLGAAHAAKIARLQDLALKMKVPVIFLNDSGGARIEEGIHALSGYGEIFQRHVQASGIIPQICAILGPCSGGACYSPALCDFTFVVKGISKMFITGPAVVESVLGRRPTFEELGGAEMHSSVSGCAHAMFEDEKTCLLGIRTLLSYLPSNCSELPPLAVEDHPIKRRLGAPVSLEEIVPDDARKPYDMNQVIRELMDVGEPVYEILKHFAPNVITGFSRLDGRVIGVVANQPTAFGGVLDCDASDKMARFIRFCDCFGIPLLTLVDVPAFLPGTDQERKGIIRHGAKVLYAYSQAVVPKITVIVRKAFGGAYIAMNSRSLGADLVYAWPIAQIAVMGAEGAVQILYGREIKNAEDPAAMLAEKQAEYERDFLNPTIAMERGYVDEVILPSETRECLIRSFGFLCESQTTPAQDGQLRRHGNIPL
ncbi:MAG: acyl-CoA carboxylase subunit beta [Lachnospiraceae bacterium]|nr:acyl-CoA carboxylase subunit beta [Lachnospiraceae bacterium]